MSNEKRVLKVTNEIVQPDLGVDMTLEEVFTSSSGSAAGFHAISGWLTCPEQSRLYSAGVRQKPSEGGGEGKLSALDFGTLAHHLRGIRILYGVEVMEQVLERFAAHLHPDDYMLASLLFRTYELNYPLARDREAFETLGVEVEVVSDVSSMFGTPILRSVRYDTIIRAKTGEVFSFEAKTMSRSGQSSLNPYIAQAMTQCAIWNRNASLVAQYGRMRGVLFDCLIKTKTPNVDRVGPRYFGVVHDEMALSYLRLPENGGATFTVQKDGTYPKMLHACYGRWRPCEYVNLCHEQSYGEYQYRDGRQYAKEG